MPNFTQTLATINLDLKELNDQLIALGIGKDEYYLHGLFGSANDNEKLALVLKSDSSGVSAEVYFKEKGIKNDSKIFNSEAEACEYFFNRMKSLQETINKHFRKA